MSGTKATLAIGVWLILGTVQLVSLNVWLIPQALAHGEFSHPLVERPRPSLPETNSQSAAEPTRPETAPALFDVPSIHHLSEAVTSESATTPPAASGDLGADDESAAFQRHLTIHFRTNARAIGSAQEDALTRFIAPLIQSKLRHIIIDGHADARGSVTQNYALSVDRSDAVRDLLVSHGVDASRITVRAHGSAQLVDRETTPQAHARNRRVELQIE